MSEDVQSAIEKNAAGPRRAKGDSGEIEQHNLKDQIEADRYLASRAAGAKPAQSLRITKLSPPGAA